MLTDLQRTKIERRFQALDHDGDGFLEQSDYAGLAADLAERLGRADPAAMRRVHDAYLGIWEAIRRGADTDDDGRVDLAEFTAALEKGVIGRDGGFDRAILPSVLAVLDFADLDGDGYIDAIEFHRWYVGPDRPQQDAEAVFARLDTDGDGRLSKEELTAAMREFYCGTDPNAPGNDLYGRLT
ncbi:EF-hand domain-containing protein [Spirillospora sp. NPDC048911]|uniref:EF-hand domain-containing protein n=1 Tax=Spirillospora sp. NPDC048911 TaxID=3364527 RepID=UPI00371E7240